MTSPDRSLLQRLLGPVLRWAAERRQREEDARYWQAAMSDPRMMADITCAIARSQGQPAAQPIFLAKRPPVAAPSTSGLRLAR